MASSSSKSSTSNIWKYFHVSNDANYANCNLCAAKISRGKVSGTTSAMWKHLKVKHAPEFQQLKDGRSSPPLTTSVSPESALYVLIDAPIENNGNEDLPCTPGSVNSDGFYEPPEKRFFGEIQSFNPEDVRDGTITRLIAKMICKDGRPLSVAEDEGFKKLINHLEPRYVIPSRRDLVEKVIPALYEEEKVKVAGILEKIEFVAVTTDVWTSASSEEYLSLTVHFVDENFEYRHFCLECIPYAEISHTPSTIKNFITNTMKEWNLADKVVCVMRDNGCNMVTAIERTSFHHLPCIANTFQDVITDGLLNKSEIKEIITSCRIIVGCYKHSSKAKKILRACQTKLNLKLEHLVPDEPTVWNSQINMLARLVEQKQAVLLSASDLHFKVELSARQWTIIEEIIRMLEVFDRATSVATSSQVTISEVIPLVNCTIRALQNFQSSLGLQGFRNDLLAALKKRYQTVETEKLYALSTVLDPRFKGKMFLSKGSLEKAKSALVSEITDIGDTLPPKDTAEVMPIEHSMWGFYSEIMVPDNSNEASYNLSPKNEIKEYLAEALLSPTSDVFKYWKDNKKYQNLRKLAKKFLITPPSTRIVDEKRSRLDSEIIQMLVFLNKNFD